MKRRDYSVRLKIWWTPKVGAPRHVAWRTVKLKADTIAEAKARAVASITSSKRPHLSSSVAWVEMLD